MILREMRYSNVLPILKFHLTCVAIYRSHLMCQDRITPEDQVTGFNCLVHWSLHWEAALPFLVGIEELVWNQTGFMTTAILWSIGIIIIRCPSCHHYDWGLNPGHINHYDANHLVTALPVSEYDVESFSACTNGAHELVSWIGEWKCHKLNTIKWVIIIISYY